jgi:hypothetical protein
MIAANQSCPSSVEAAQSVGCFFVVPWVKQDSIDCRVVALVGEQNQINEDVISRQSPDFDVQCIDGVAAESERLAIMLVDVDVVTGDRIRRYEAG